MLPVAHLPDLLTAKKVGNAQGLLTILKSCHHWQNWIVRAMVDIDKPEMIRHIPVITGNEVELNNLTVLLRIRYKNDIKKIYPLLREVEFENKKLTDNNK